MSGPVRLAMAGAVLTVAAIPLGGFWIGEWALLVTGTGLTVVGAAIVWALVQNMQQTRTLFDSEDDPDGAA